MLDIRFIRENAELVAEKSAQKGYDVDVKKILHLDDEKRSLLMELESVRRKSNQFAKQGIRPDGATGDLTVGKQLKKEAKELEAKLDPIDRELSELLNNVPNMPADDVPVGASEEENQVAKEWGEKPIFSFEPRTHWEIAQSRGLIDKERAAKVAGSRFAYIKGDLVKLQFALMNFSTEVLTNKETLQKIIKKAGLKVSDKPFVLVLPPLMIRTEVFEAMDRLEPRDDRYKIEGDDLWLQGSAEHTLGSMHINELLQSDDLPLRYAGYATSFRREAGTYGKDTEGIVRMHQFDKLEMESFSRPEEGLEEHLFMVAIQEHLMQKLKLPYRVLQKCTADIGKPNARGIDLEVWLPSQKGYKETHTADYMTDYQARRLQTRFKKGDQTVLVHTNDATAFAMGRALVGIIENYQTENFKIKIPEVLKPYIGGLEEI